MSQQTNETTTLNPVESVLRVLREAEKPLTMAELVKRNEGLSLTRGQVQSMIEEQVQQGKVFLCSPTGKQSRYWIHDEFAKIREQLEQFLANGARTERDILRQLREKLGTVSNDRTIRETLGKLREQARLFLHPRKGKADLFGLEPHDPVAKIQLNTSAMKALRSALEKARDAGATVEQFLGRLEKMLLGDGVSSSGESQATTAPTSPVPSTSMPSGEVELKNLLMKVFQEAGSGVPVPVAEVRQHMPAEYRTKSNLDPVIWNLVKEGTLFVVPAEHPNLLPPADREALLEDQTGTYYGFVGKSSRS
ncbi:MAG: hypothetical protein ACKO23_17115 [Gemmataceae bacterium]